MLQGKIDTEIVGINGIEVSGKEAIVVLDRVLQTSHTVDLLLRMDNGAIETVTLLPLSLRQRFISIFQRLPEERMSHNSAQSFDHLSSSDVTRDLSFKNGEYQTTPRISNEWLRRIFPL